MLELIKPILVAFVTSKPVKKLIVDLLRALASKSETQLDDAAVDFIETRLG